MQADIGIGDAVASTDLLAAFPANPTIALRRHAVRRRGDLA